ncbi:NUDIX hydrolase [Hyphomicrobium nitrativorans NL23]|uniref:NUDIX hydrolase n=1 Tax=Hyphomicrobium nitrativorans NL23 TaxID=1029756 RepID=V5SGU7_9HYPH|nr:NUDIX hydrolase [Hyphomicrobium nitrativorans]AHB49179.1 NUDIX hydrolase [Hyphomicrobium nitrativorans NL23]
MGQQIEARLIEATRVDLRVTDAEWAFARQYQGEIAAHWARRSAENPHYFNGTVLLLSDYALSDDGVVSGRLLRTDFMSFLYWRETGCPEAGIYDTFCTALIRSREGHVLLCQQRPGNLNEGFATPPGGFIDERDVDADGTIDLSRAVTREIAEETGLGAPLLRQGAGFAILLVRHQVSLAVPWHSDLSGDDLVRKASLHIAGEAEGELLRTLSLSPGEALRTLSLPDYARVLLSASDVLKTSA